MSVLTHDQLIFQQTKSFSKNDFAIMDTQGQQVAHVGTAGSALGRAFVGARELTVLDGPGNPIVQVKDTVTFGRDRMEILDGAGTPLASHADTCTPTTATSHPPQSRPTPSSPDPPRPADRGGARPRGHCDGEPGATTGGSVPLLVPLSTGGVFQRARYALRRL